MKHSDLVLILGAAVVLVVVVKKIVDEKKFAALQASVLSSDVYASAGYLAS